MMVSLALSGKRKIDHQWEQLVGYTISELKLHLEELFKPEMSWDNYGREGWEVDHILPVILFDFSNEEEIRKCWALSNLQPLWSLDNKIKGKKVANL